MTNKARVAKVDLGFVEIEGLLLPNGEYAIGASQTAKLFQFDQNQASRLIKRKLGKDFQFDQYASELHPKKVNTISLTFVSKLALALAKEGNNIATNFLEAAFEEALDRRFDKAFDKKRSEDEYNARLKARVEGKQVRWDFTDSIKAYIQRNNIQGMEAKFLYKNATDRLYSNLTGYSSTKKLREKENIPLSHTPRDYASDRDLKHIAEIEAAAQRYIDLKNIHPIDAIDLVTKQLLLKYIGWNKATRI